MGVWGVVIVVLSVMHVVGGVPLWVVCVCMSVVSPVAILSAVFCVICSLLMFVSGGNLREYGSCYGFYMLRESFPSPP